MLIICWTSSETKMSKSGIVLHILNHFKLLVVFVLEILHDFLLNFGRILWGLSGLLDVIKQHHTLKGGLRQYQRHRDYDDDGDFHKPLPIPHKGKVSFPPVDTDRHHDRVDDGPQLKGEVVPRFK